VVYLAADIGVLSGGFISGALIKRGAAPAAGRLRVMFGCAALVPLAALIPHAGSVALVLAIGMVAIFAHLAWLTNLSALVVDLVPRPSLGFAFGIVATGSSLGGMMMNKAVGALVTNHSYDPAFHFMLLVHPLAWVLLWQLRPHHVAATTDIS
jgi:ACS family hexuronate transporter-like MFS transporter